MNDETLTTRRLNRALLARQLLLERSSLPIPRAVERVAGIQAQYAPSAYIGLWSRLQDFRRPRLTQALERRSVVQGTLMRATIHVVSRADYRPVADAIREPRLQWWLQATKTDIGTLEEAAARVRHFLADGPRSRKEIVDHLGLDAASWNGIGMVLDLVRAPPSGTWERRRADLYALADQWLGPSDSNREDGTRRLVERYLRGFGPASRTDIHSFTGLPMQVLTPVLELLRLRRFRDEAGVELLDLPRAPLPEADTPAPVRFLPTWDATLLVHARRTQVLPERFRPLLFSTKTPHSFPTFLVNGQVAGTWRHENGRIELEPYEPLPPRAVRELQAEAEGLALLHA